MRALAAGIPRDEIDDTTIEDIDKAFRALQLKTFLQAKAQLDLEMHNVSAVSLGEANDPDEQDEKRREKLEKKRARWEAVGERIKAQMYEARLFALMPDYMQATYIAVNGLPGDDEMVSREPLSGISPRAARSILRLLEDKVFTHGDWARSYFRLQLLENDARQRLEATARLLDGVDKL